MRMTHRLSRVLGAAALAATLATAGATTAVRADPGPRDDRGPSYRQAAAPDTPPPPLALLGPAHRRVHSEVVWRSGRLYLRGDVEAWSVRPVQVQRKSCDTCLWRRHAVVWTGRKGGFRSAISAPKRGSTFWRARVRASGGYARSFSATWETYY
jgi:hypothetical protein